MTDESMTLIDLAEKHADGDFLRALGQYVLQELMELEAQAKCGAGKNERSEDRVNQRNGYRERRLETRIGTMSLQIPKLRQGSYFPSFLNPRKTTEQALVAVVQEAFVKGISTRKVDDLVQAMGMTGISKSQVSRLCQEIDERVQAFLTRPIEGRFPFIWLDATYLKVRDNGRVINKAVVIAVGAHEDGHREVLGLDIGAAETYGFWKDFLRGLVKRGLQGVQLATSDAHEGLKQAIAETLSSGWQRCRVHFMRNALAHVPRQQHQMVAAVIRTAFVQENPEQAVQQWRETASKLRERFPKLGQLMDDAEADVLAFMAFPKEIWPKLASTNPLERLNKEIKRRSRVVEIFPNDDAVVRLVGALVAEQSDEWQVTRRYMTQETIDRVYAKPDNEETKRIKQQAA